MVGRTPAKIDTVVAEITALGVGSAEAIPSGVTDGTEVMVAFDRAMSPGTWREPVDVVISNAGNNAVTDFTQLIAV